GLTSLSSDSPLLGVNTPRSDEDRLKLRELKVFLLKKGVCDEFGLNAARLSKLLLTGKCEVTRLQALVDKKRIMITEEVVHEILQLNDAEGVICLPNEEIFAGLARMGYEKPVGKGFSGVETPLFESIVAVRDVAEEAEAQVPAQGLENDKAAQQPEIVKLKARVKKLEKINKVLSMQKDVTDVQEAVEIVTTAKLMTEVVTVAATQVAAASTPIPAAKPRILTITVAPAVSTRRRKGVVAKGRKLSEEAQEADDLRKRLEIVQDKDDDVFVEATPLAQKVPIVDYQIVVIENKPKYKIIRAEDTHQFYISFTTLLKNFDREDLEALWKI
nr:hypothetical protein [Tanacetum cinerariifolium]